MLLCDFIFLLRTELFLLGSLPFCDCRVCWAAHLVTPEPCCSIWVEVRPVLMEVLPAVLREDWTLEPVDESSFSRDFIFA